MTPVDSTRGAFQNALKTFRSARKELRANDLAALFDDVEALFVEFSQAMGEERFSPAPRVPNVEQNPPAEPAADPAASTEPAK